MDSENFIKVSQNPNKVARDTHGLPTVPHNDFVGLNFKDLASNYLLLMATNVPRRGCLGIVVAADGRCSKRSNSNSKVAGSEAEQMNKTPTAGATLKMQRVSKGEYTSGPPL